MAADIISLTCCSLIFLPLFFPLSSLRLFSERLHWKRISDEAEARSMSFVETDSYAVNVCNCLGPLHSYSFLLHLISSDLTQNIYFFPVWNAHDDVHHALHLRLLPSSSRSLRKNDAKGNSWECCVKRHRMIRAQRSLFRLFFSARVCLSKYFPIWNWSAS